VGNAEHILLKTLLRATKALSAACFSSSQKEAGLVGKSLPSFLPWFVLGLALTC
jgi:hypothetical protein